MVICILDSNSIQLRFFGKATTQIPGLCAMERNECLINSLSIQLGITQCKCEEQTRIDQKSGTGAWPSGQKSGRYGADPKDPFAVVPLPKDPHEAVRHSQLPPSPAP